MLAGMDSDDWDARYASVERVWSVEPNRWLVDAVTGLEPGRALDLACGEGRNAVWLRRLGWEVTAVDFSDVGLAKGRAADPEVDWVGADVRTWTPPASAFDLVAIVYLHLPAGERRAVLASATSALTPGGTLVVIGHDRRNLVDGVGGPQDPEVLLDPAELVDELAGLADLDVLRAETVDRPVGDDTARDTFVVVRRVQVSPAARATSG